MDSKLVDEFNRERMLELKNIMTKQFELSYYTNVNKLDTDEMSILELKNWYQLLVERKKDENNDK